ncbi:38976_t:CDS:2, partial [Gigaspora margarita]
FKKAVELRKRYKEYKQGQRKESSNLENTFLNTNNNSDKAAETTKESEDSRKMNSEGKKGENLQEKEQKVIMNEVIVQEQYQTMQCEIIQAKTQSSIETIQNNNTEDQEMIEAGFTIVTNKKRNTRSATGMGSSNERHKPYKKDEGGRGRSTSKERYKLKLDNTSHVSPEMKVTRLHKRIAELQKEVIRYSEREELKIVIEQLQENLQEELTSLAERWQIQSNTRWIEEGE